MAYQSSPNYQLTGVSGLSTLETLCQGRFTISVTPLNLHMVQFHIFAWLTRMAKSIVPFCISNRMGPSKIKD